MRPERRVGLEQTGYQVIEYTTLDSYWNTDTFIITPDGKTLADYTNLSDIPLLNDNTQITIDPIAFPYDDQIGFYCAKVDGGAILYSQTAASADGLFIPVIGWIVIAIVAALAVTAIFMVTSALHPDPLCKQEPRQQDIGTCAKLIVMPNCDTRTFNPCTGEWIDADWTSHSTNDWMMYVILAIAGIAAIVIIPKILGMFEGKIRIGGGPPPEKVAEEPVY
jgi:hypothetical protein